MDDVNGTVRRPGGLEVTSRSITTGSTLPVVVNLFAAWHSPCNPKGRTEAENRADEGSMEDSIGDLM